MPLHYVLAVVLALSACATPRGALTNAGSDAGAEDDAESETDAGSMGAEQVSAELSALCRDDLQLTDAECQALAGMTLPTQLPPARGNRFADDPDAAQLGFRIFFDPRFSSVPEVRCATCHLPERSFGDGKPVSEVIPGRPVKRNSPSILNAARSGPFFLWDGRADSLWSQPLFALENPDEMATTRLAIAHALADQPFYKAMYEKVFGPLPALADLQRFPAAGKPGDASYDAMAASDQDAINLIAANVGKALEAYMRKVATGPSTFDAYLSGSRDALQPAARAGLRTFLRTGCSTCHSGSTLSDGLFHAFGETAGDRGRADGLQVLLDNPFNSQSSYYDRTSGEPAPTLPAAATKDDESAFRTPTLRNIDRTAPYGHDGRASTLGEFLPTHAKLDDEQLSQLWVFLRTLDGAYPQRPWSDWPAI